MIDINDKVTMFFAKSQTSFDEHPNFEQIQEGSANCRFDFNKEYPNGIIYQVIGYIKYHADLNKYILYSEIGFKNG